MNISIFNYESDVIDDFEGIDGLVYLTSGDIYEDEDPFGTYVAMWRVDDPAMVNILVTPYRKTAGNDYLSPVLTIGLQYTSDSNLVGVDPYILPWSDADDGICFGQYVKPNEYQHYSLAQKALEIATAVVNLDESIRARFSL